MGGKEKEKTPFFPFTEKGIVSHLEKRGGEEGKGYNFLILGWVQGKRGGREKKGLRVESRKEEGNSLS